MARDQLSRDPDNALLGGVCAGIGRHYGFDVTVVRIVWLVLTVFSAGTSIILYIAAWVIMPLPSEEQPGAGQERGGANRPLEQPGDVLPARERVVETGRVLLAHTRQSAQEIGRIARGERAGNRDGSSTTGGADSSAPAAPQPPTQPGASQPFSAGDTPTSADPPGHDNPPPPPQSPV